MLCEGHGGLWPDLAIPTQGAARVVIPEGVRRVACIVLSTYCRENGCTFSWNIGGGLDGHPDGVRCSCQHVKEGSVDIIYSRMASGVRVRTQGARPSLSTLD